METEAKEEEGVITGNLVFDLCVVEKEGAEEQRRNFSNKGGVNCDTA